MPKRKAKILIVDDAQINRMILCELLRNQYQILEAEDGKKALEIMKEDKTIDLVLLDIVMPNMDGYRQPLSASSSVSKTSSASGVSPAWRRTVRPW